MNENESFSMWDKYAGYSNGIAIKTTTRKLWEAFQKQYELNTVMLSRVKYVDYQESYCDTSSYVYQFVNKDISYEKEKEVRAIFMADLEIMGPRINDVLNNSVIKNDIGIGIKIDIEDFLDEVYISPYANEDISNKVKEVLESNGLSIPIKKSTSIDIY